MVKLVCLLGLGLLSAAAATNAVGSAGCGKPLTSKYTEGETTYDVSFTAPSGEERSYQLFVPDGYDESEPLPLVFSVHGWGGTSLEDSCDSGMTAVAKNTSEFIVAHLQGMQDYPKGQKSQWGAWHFNGSCQNGGVSCDTSQRTDQYCYESNDDCQDCDWTTCVDDVGFVDALFDAVEGELCVDTTREYVTGMSNGGMMTYQLGASLSHRLAAIAPVAGSMHWQNLVVPEIPIAVLDIHGTQDTTVPGNATDADGKVSDGTWWYYSTEELHHSWHLNDACRLGSPHQYPTSWDGVDGLYCVSECDDDSLVRCVWDGKHQYFGGKGEKYIFDCTPENLDEVYADNGFLVWEFFKKHSLAL